MKGILRFKVCDVVNEAIADGGSTSIPRVKPMPGEPGVQVNGGYAGLSARMVSLPVTLSVVTAGKKRPQNLTQKAMQALTEAVSKTVGEHRKRGIPLAVWRNGRAVSVPAKEAGSLRETTMPFGRKAKAEPKD